MIPGIMIHTDTIMILTDGIMDGVLDFHTVIRTGALAFHMDIRTITLHGILRGILPGTLPGIVIHTGGDPGMHITAAITEIITDIPSVTFTRPAGEYITEEVTQSQVPAEAAVQYQVQELQDSRESHVM
jgi:hypothetical protein